MKTILERAARIKVTLVQAALAGSQPMTALLYQLYLESGSSINVTDLWSAFSAMIGDEETVEDQQTVYVFVRRSSGFNIHVSDADN